MQTSTDFKLNSKVLFDKIEAIKKNPPAEIAEFKASHPEFKTVNCALIAEYIGLSEKTLTNLKLGKLTDSNCSTVWLICTMLGIDPRDYFGMPRQSECNPESCSSHAQARLDEKRQRIAELEALTADQDSRLVNLRNIIHQESKELGEAKGQVAVYEHRLKECEDKIARRDSGIKMRNRLICILIALIIIAVIAAFYFLWEAMNPYAGRFRV